MVFFMYCDKCNWDILYLNKMGQTGTFKMYFNEFNKLLGNVWAEVLSKTVIHISG